MCYARSYREGPFCKQLGNRAFEPLVDKRASPADADLSGTFPLAGKVRGRDLLNRLSAMHHEVSWM